METDPGALSAEHLEHRGVGPLGAPGDRVGVVEEQIDLLHDAVNRRKDQTDPAIALEADPEGIGDAIGRAAPRDSSAIGTRRP